MPVSPVTGAVDAFEWKAPLDAIGRGDDTLLIEERPEPVAAEEQVVEPPPAPREGPVPLERKADVVDATPAKCVASPAEAEAVARPVQAEPKPKPAIFVPDRPPDDPGVGQAEAEETLPTSLERLRAAQIR
jgi:HemY protein